MFRPGPHFRILRHSRLLLLTLALANFLSAQVHRIEKAAPGLIEAGSQQFTIINKETLGLNSPPTDLHLLPDGRILAVAGSQLAYGDGIRWEVFNQADGEEPSRAMDVALDASGTIYQSIRGGFARVDFRPDGRWHLEKIADWPKEDFQDRPVPRHIINTGRQWYWHSNSGNVLSWRPGATAQVRGAANTVAWIFDFKGVTYLCDWDEGDVTILRSPGPDVLLPRRHVLPEKFVTCSVPLNDKEILLGTNTLGLQRFDGERLVPFPLLGGRSGNSRINTLCAVDGGYFAAAVETVGLVFFDAEGRTIQVLNSQYDHRLNRVQKLVAGPNGLVWGLLNDSILLLQFPSRFSHFEPIINTGIATVHPNRLNGRLWLMADNHLQRAVYEEDGRLKEFVRDSPPGQQIFSLSCVLNAPVAASDQGAFYRAPDGWVNFAPEAKNLRILQNEPIEGWWPYYAENEIGWIRAGEQGPERQRYPHEGPGKVFNSITDTKGNIWLEFGSGLLGRYAPGHPGEKPPPIQLFGAAEGVPESWAQVFIVDDKVRFNIADRILQLDPTGMRLVPDEEFSRAFAGLGTIVGRPGRDARGRLWVTTEQGVHAYTGPLNQLQKLPEPAPAGFQPYYFTFESGGVVWMHSTRRLARYDPDLPLPPPYPLHALITHVNLPGSGRVLIPSDGTLPALPYDDHSLIPHFLAIGKDIDDAVTFETRLVGSGQEWLGVGSSGAAVFNGLIEGDYVLQVRPIGRHGPGQLSQLAFVIHPPWYRTIPAYIAGILLLSGLVLGSAWLLTYLQRLEKLRLENLVQERTNELKSSNDRLATQVDEIRTLSQAIEQSPVGVMLVQPDGRITFANLHAGELFGCPAATLIGRHFPLAEPHQVAACAHLTALVAAREQGREWKGQLDLPLSDTSTRHLRLTSTPLQNPTGGTTQHLVLAEDITTTLAEEENRRRLEAQLFMAQKRESLGTLAGGIAHDFNNILTGILGYNEIVGLTLGENSPVSQELAAIRSAGQRAKELVSQILAFTRQGHAQLKPLDLARTVSEALKLIRATTPATIAIEQHLQSGTIRADGTKIHQIVLNLCTNAIHAMRAGSGRLEFRLNQIELTDAQAANIAGLSAGPHMRLTVSDTGEGMDRATLDRIFDPFFTTKGPGEGTGLGLSIVQGIVVSHKGGLLVRSARGQGTTFELYFPRCEEAGALTTPPMDTPAGQSQEVVVVDDEAMVTGFVSVRLQKIGYRPTVFNDPRTALTEISANPGRYRAIITDLTMPHMTGVELIRRLQERGITLPTLIVTGYNLNAARADLASLPQCQVLLKPFSGEELGTALYRVLQRAAVT